MANVHIIGVGAIGTFLAASLAIAGHDVVVIARGARAESLRANGLSIDRQSRYDRVLAEVRNHCENLPRPDIAFLCTKADDLAVAVRLLSVYADDPPILVTVQNGVDAPQSVAEHFPGAVVVASRVHGFFVLNELMVTHVGVKPSILFGLWQHGDANTIVQLTQLLSSAGISNAQASDIRIDLWEKMLLASAVGSVGAALGIPVGKIGVTPHARNLLKAVMTEIAFLADLKGVNLSKDCVNQNLRFVDSFPENATSSLQRDLEAGRNSEFKHLTGAVLRMAEELALDLPANRSVKELIEARGFLAS